ncbi:hypothetical protein PR048_013134 [Dryococelus australis]|uniref:Peptidase A2 domain-containing protein n=1 Tax=Dryococelus australis TaxID=614101 RepID=A0ABQ9HRB3_9NEOP|nr:hypothetical protein PR048_013134 [Dryococelus australis]
MYITVAIAEQIVVAVLLDSGALCSLINQDNLPKGRVKVCQREELGLSIANGGVINSKGLTIIKTKIANFSWKIFFSNLAWSYS